MKIHAYLLDFDKEWHQGDTFPIVTNDEVIPEKLQIVRQTEVPTSLKFYRLVKGITIDECPVYHETYKEN